MLLSMTIPNSYSPCKNIDIYIQALIDELKGKKTFKRKKKNNIKARMNITIFCDHQNIKLLNNKECVAKLKKPSLS